MPKILQINIRVNKGSVSRITEQIGVKVLEQGWESYVAYGRPSNPSKSHMIPIGSYNSVKLHYLMSNLTGRHGLFSTRATKQLVEKIIDLKPDIIHLQNIHGYYINYRILFEYLNSTDIPVVWTLHDCWSFTGHCSHFVSANCDRWKNGCHDCPLKHDYPRSLFFDFSKKDYELKKKLFAGNKNLHLVPVSHWLEGLVKQSYFKDHDIRVIHNGIDLSVFYPRQHKGTNKTKILGVAGVWGRGKGLYDFFTLRERLPKDKFDITLIGLTAEQIAEIPDGIKGVQRTDSVEQLAEYYSDADIFVNLTYADTFPTVNLESLACGTPIITYRTGGSPETIDESTGIVIEQGDIDALVEAVNVYRHLIPLEREEQRKTCRKRAEEYYEKGKCFEEYIALYKTLSGGGQILNNRSCNNLE